MLASCGKESDPAPAAGGPGNASPVSGGGAAAGPVTGSASPKEAWDAVAAAGKAKNWGGFWDAVDPEEQAEMVGVSLMIAGFSTMGDEKAGEEFKALCVKHGLDPEEKPAPDEDPKEGMKKLKAKLKDPRAFFVDAFAFADSRAKEGQGFDANKLGTLGEVKVDGDTATADSTTPDGKVKPITFVKRSGRWYLRFPK
jgi:hypothetical protein